MFVERVADFAAKFKTRFARFSGCEFCRSSAARTTDGECAAIIINLKRGVLRDLIKYMENFTEKFKTQSRGVNTAD
jgi:hypothetical protein